MIDITGKLSDLYKNNTKTEIAITTRLCESMINKPITDGKGNCIGSIIDYDLEQDRWYGVLYKKETPELRVDDLKMNECMGIVVK